MRVLVTGGAGFIGSHLSEALVGRGDEVLVLDNFATARRDSLPGHPRLRLVEGTVFHGDLLERLVDEFRPEQVVHAAASYKDPEAWVEDVRTNVLGTVHVVQAARRAGVRRLIYFQTSLCYGPRPLTQPIRLDHPLRPESSYAISKTAAEHYIQLSGLDYVSFRLANVYGPRNLSGPLPTFYQRLGASKPCFVADSRRDFIYISDLIQVVLLALEGRGERGVYHVSSGSDQSIKELFDATVRAMGISPPPEVEVRPRSVDDVYTILLDPSKTNRDFGWRAVTPLEDGVREAVAWYRTHGVAETYTHLRATPAVEAS